MESLGLRQLEESIGYKMIIIDKRQMILATLKAVTSKGNFIFDDNFEVYKTDIIERKVYIFKEEETKNG